MKPVPSQEQIQGWILSIKPHEIIERFIEKPGLLVLRVKYRVCAWRGLHLALADGWREHLGDHLLVLSSGRVDRLQYQVSSPDGRAWFDLFTSGTDFGSWSGITFELDAQASSAGAWVRYVGNTVHVRLSAQAASTLAAELARPLDGGIRSSLVLWRDLRPSFEPQALWLWRWLEKDGTG